MSTHPDLAQRIIINLALLDDLDDAFGQAERYARSPDRDPEATFFFLPETAAMLRDPRFIPLAAQFGLVDYWRATGQWPDFCHDPTLPYDCKAEAARIAPRR